MPWTREENILRITILTVSTHLYDDGLLLRQEIQKEDCISLKLV